MLDMKRLRDDLENIVERLNKRGEDHGHLRDIVKSDERRRALLKEIESLKARRNEISKNIGIHKREGKDVGPLLEEVEKDKQRISDMEEELKRIEQTIKETMLEVPNVPHADIPVGEDDTDNVELRKVGRIPDFTFEPKPHWEVARDLDILDFERAAKISASRFVIYKGLGARLERALINFMIDLHAQEHGYKEVLLPYIVNEGAMTATGQLPKFKDDAFKLTDERGLYLNPTAEVPGINMHRDEILAAADLPINYVAFTTAFRQEIGSAGRDTRGIIRQHQFNKVELIKFTTPETSYDELEKMLRHSEKVLQKLDLPYRVVEICSGDLGFAMAKTYDIEVYVPSYGGYREIGSISNAEDFQARRGGIRFRRAKDAKPEFAHTLNGSGLAVGRTVVAILENNQQEDGSVIVPEALRPYIGTDIIK